MCFTDWLTRQRYSRYTWKSRINCNEIDFQSVLRRGYLEEMIQVLSDPRYGSNLAQVEATVKKHEAISADILARVRAVNSISVILIFYDLTYTGSC